MKTEEPLDKYFSQNAIQNTGASGKYQKLCFKLHSKNEKVYCLCF